MELSFCVVSLSLSLFIPLERNKLRATRGYQLWWTWIGGLFGTLATSVPRVCQFIWSFTPVSCSSQLQLPSEAKFDTNGQCYISMVEDEITSATSGDEDDPYDEYSKLHSKICHSSQYWGGLGYLRDVFGTFKRKLLAGADSMSLFKRVLDCWLWNCYGYRLGRHIAKVRSQEKWSQSYTCELCMEDRQLRLSVLRLSGIWLSVRNTVQVAKSEVVLPSSSTRCPSWMPDTCPAGVPGCRTWTVSSWTLANGIMICVLSPVFKTY